MLEGFGRYNNLEGSRRHVVLWLPEHFNCSTNAQLSTVTVFYCFHFSDGQFLSTEGLRVNLVMSRESEVADSQNAGMSWINNIPMRTGLAGTDLMSAVCDLSS